MIGERLYSLNREHMDAALRGERREFDREVIGANGDIFQSTISYVPDIANGEPQGFFVLATDITERKRLEAERDAARTQLQSIIDTLPALICYWDRELKSRFANRAFLEWHLRDPESVHGARVRDVIGEEAFRAIEPRLQKALQGEPQTFEQRRVSPGGESRELRIDYVPDRAGSEIRGVIMLGVDVTGEKQTAERLKAQAAQLAALSITDELTGLYNRRGFLVAGGQQLKAATRSKRNAAVLFIDLDGLKEINDRRGHEAGNLAIKATAAVLRATFRDSDVLARMGGDEFAVAVFDCGAPSLLLQRLQDKLQAVNQSAGSSTPLSFSAGVALFAPEAPEPLEVLLEKADAAMYRVKRARTPPQRRMDSGNAG